MTNKLTPEEIKKALECCVGFSPKCNDCPANRYEAGECSDIVNVQAISVMNSQQAEIERLQTENNQFADIGKMYSEIRAEAIKEFVEVLTENSVYIIGYGFGISTAKIVCLEGKMERKVLPRFDKEMLITPTSKEHQSLVEQWQRHKEKYGKEMVGEQE